MILVTCGGTSKLLSELNECFTTQLVRDFISDVTSSFSKLGIKYDTMEYNLKNDVITVVLSQENQSKIPFELNYTVIENVIFIQIDTCFDNMCVLDVINPIATQ
jgi:hypothetical protein